MTGCTNLKPRSAGQRIHHLGRGLLVAAVMAVQCGAAHAASAGVSTRISSFGVGPSDADGSAGSLVFSTVDLTVPNQTTRANATAGNGSLSTFASAFTGAAIGGKQGIAQATASLSDRFSVQFDGSVSNRVLLDFAIHASGSVTSDHGAINDIFGGAARIDYSISVTGLGFAQSVGGFMERGVQFQGVVNQMVVNEEYELIGGPPLRDFQVTLAVAAETLNVFDVNMSSSSSVSYRRGKGIPGSFSGVTADFGNTFTWLGLTRAYLPDGSTYTGPLTVTSDSGFNYGRLAVAPVPEPENWALLLGGLVLVGRFARLATRRIS